MSIESSSLVVAMSIWIKSTGYSAKEMSAGGAGSDTINKKLTNADPLLTSSKCAQSLVGNILTFRYRPYGKIGH